MSKSFLAVILFWALSVTIIQAQGSERVKNHLFSNSFLGSFDVSLTYPQTDYIDASLGYGLRGSLEYFLPTYNNHSFGFRIFARYDKLSGETAVAWNLPEVPADEYGVGIFSPGLFVSYMYAFSAKVFPYISAGFSYSFFNLDDAQRGLNHINVTAENPYDNNAFSYNGELGLRMILSKMTSLNVSLGMHFLTTDYLDDVTAGDFNDAFVELSAGISISLSGEKDSDGDGILDSEDSCPGQPEDFDGFRDADGCPDDDNDGDGIPDLTDKCPNQAEDLDGFEDQDGCPDPDNDNDGILDVNDNCPNEAEDMDGFQDNDGCPDPDNDNDGIVDSQDNCPNEPETYNNYLDSDGCPDVVPLVIAPDTTTVGDTTAVLPPPPPRILLPPIILPTTTDGEAPKEILIHGEVTFYEGTSDLKPEATGDLNSVVEVLAKYPSARWRIEGHMDSQGASKVIQTISTERAESVLRFFVSKGLPASRFQILGMGDKFPIASNSTSYGRMRNRRIVIVRIN